MMAWIWLGCPAVMLEIVHAASWRRDSGSYTCVCMHVHKHSLSLSQAHLLQVGAAVSQQGVHVLEHPTVQSQLGLLVTTCDNVTHGSEGWGLGEG